MTATDVTKKLGPHSLRKRQWVVQSAGAESRICVATESCSFCVCVLMSSGHGPKGTFRGEGGG